MVMQKPKENEVDENSFIYTCSDCINDHLVNVWAIWTDSDEELCEQFKLIPSQIQPIKIWVDNNFNEKKIGWNVFTNLETALEYKRTFFSHLNDIKMMALYFDKDERADILNKFKPSEEPDGGIGLLLTLLNEVEEKEGEEADNDKFLGFDYIGIGINGSFHSFHCHGMGKELSDKFNLTLNEFGLFDSNINSKQVLDFLNDESNGCEPCPWFIAKIKLVMNK